MTDKHPTDALPMPAMPFIQTEENLLEWCRAYGIACHNLGRESMREEAAKTCDEADKSTHPADLADAIRSIEL